MLQYQWYQSVYSSRCVLSLEIKIFISTERFAEYHNGIQMRLYHCLGNEFIKRCIVVVDVNK